MVPKGFFRSAPAQAATAKSPSERFAGRCDCQGG